MADGNFKILEDLTMTSLASEIINLTLGNVTLRRKLLLINSSYRFFFVNITLANNRFTVLQLAEVKLREELSADDGHSVFYAGNIISCRQNSPNC